MEKTNLKIACGISIIAYLVLELFTGETWNSITSATTAGIVSFWLYDRFLWRLFSDIPKVYGMYKSENWSSYAGGTKYNSKVIIKQTSSKIVVKETIANGSTCESIMASLAKMTENGDWYLYYVYVTNPTAASGDSMHYGTVALRIESRDRLIGSYYTDRDNQTKGEMRLTRKK